MTRDETIKALLMRRESRVPTRRIYAFDEDGNTYEVKHATRESGKWKKGSLKIPPTAKAVCLEGDADWQPLPGFLTTVEFKRREAVKRKDAKNRSNAKAAATAPSATSR